MAMIRLALILLCLVFLLAWAFALEALVVKNLTLLGWLVCCVGILLASVILGTKD